jgi:peptidoglycan/LPS O-acetylase OafA/YrhL
MACIRANAVRSGRVGRKARYRAWCRRSSPASGRSAFQSSSWAFFLIAAAIGKTDRGLAIGGARRSGRLSYSLYLWHVPVLWAFDRHDRAIALIVSFPRVAVLSP